MPDPMLDRLEFPIDPIEHMLDLSMPKTSQSPLYASYPSLNCRVDSHRIKKRDGYSVFRTLFANKLCYDVRRFQLDDGTYYDMALTETDLLRIETASGKTYTYVTSTNGYSTTEQVDIVNGVTITFEAPTTLTDDDVAAGDQFTLVSDSLTDEEPDASWRTVESIDSATQLTLTAAYEDNHGSPAGEDALIRRVHSIPADERPAIEIVDNKYIYSSGDIEVQSYTGSGYASSLNSTWARKARILRAYADRLCLADLYYPGEPGTITFTDGGSAQDDMTAGGASSDESLSHDYVVQIDGAGATDTFKWSDDGGSTWEASTVAVTGSAQALNNNVTITFAAITGHAAGDKWEFSCSACARDRWRLLYSKQADATDYTHSSAGYYDFFSTSDYINQLGVVGPNLFVYLKDSYHIGNRQTDSTNPMSFATHRIGKGVWARDSLVHVMGTNAFLWRDDFYIISGNDAVAIGERIRHDFFNLVPEENLPYVWGQHYPRKHEVVWVADTTDGRLAFTWDYKEEEWYIYRYWDSVVGGGVT